MAGLPDSILALAEHSAAEDLALAILRARISEVPIVTAIELKQTFPVVLVRRLPTTWQRNTDERFFDSIELAVHCFAEDGTQDGDSSGDKDAAILSDACRIVLRDAALDHFYDPDLGSVTWMEVTAFPRRAPDWATSAGPVQYADLPSNVVRYEARYHLCVRKPLSPPYA